MNKILSILTATFISIISFFQTTVIHQSTPQPSGVPVIETTTSPSPNPSFKPVKDIYSPTPILTSTPKLTIIPSPTHSPQPEPTPTQSLSPSPKSYPDGFSPVTRTVSLHQSATAKSDNCLPGASGEITVSLTNYDLNSNTTQSGITDFKMTGQIRGLKHNTKYIVSLDDRGNPLGGPFTVTDAQGNASIDRSGGYTVNYRNIYNVFVYDPEKIHPDGDCLIGDFGQGQG